MIVVERNNDKITSFQLMVLLIATMIGVGILALPRDITEAVGPDGWVLVVLGTFITLILVILMTKVVEKFPQKTFKEIVNSLVGKFLGTIIILGFCIYFIVLTAFEVRSFGEGVKEYLLLHTPIEILIISLLIVSAYSARSGIESIARLSQVIVPGSIFFAFLAMFPILPELDMSHLLPVLRTPPLKIIKSLPIVLFSFLGTELVLVFSVFVSDVRNITKRVSMSVGIVFLVYLLIVVTTVTRFGLRETSHIIWPGLEIFRTVDIPGAFIENIQIIVIAIWICLVFMTVVAWTLGGSLLISYIFRSREQNYFVLPLMPIIYSISLLPENFPQIRDYMNAFLKSFGIAYIVILPILLWILTLFKTRKRSGRSA
jgi:spore germination protein